MVGQPPSSFSFLGFRSHFQFGTHCGYPFPRGQLWILEKRVWEQALRVTWIDLVVPSGGLKTDSNILQPSNGVVHLMSYDLPPSSFLILFMISWLQILNGLPSSTLAFCPHSWGNGRPSRLGRDQLGG